MRFYTKELGADVSETLDTLKEHGGLIVENVDEATHLLADILTKEVQDLNPKLSRRTTHWVKDCCKCRTTVWPTKALEWKGWQFQPVPGPDAGIPCSDGKPAIITLTGYTGYQRESLKTLINMTGAKCTSALTKSNTHLLCKEPNSKKAAAAASWGVKVVNHLWIMDSVLTWKWQPHDQYKTPGEKIFEDQEWTCLSQNARDSASMKHPRDLVEKTWPLVEKDSDVDFEDFVKLVRKQWVAVGCSGLQCEGGEVKEGEKEENEDEDGENKEDEKSSRTSSPVKKRGRSMNVQDDKEVCTFACGICVCLCVCVFVCAWGIWPHLCACLCYTEQEENEDEEDEESQRDEEEKKNKRKKKSEKRNEKKYETVS